MLADTPNVVVQIKIVGNYNSLDEIELFILKHYSDDDSCFPPTVQADRGASVATTKKHREFTSSRA